jgi:hypothetical protein
MANILEVDTSIGFEPPLVIPGEEVEIDGIRYYYSEAILREDQFDKIAEAVYNRGVRNAEIVPQMIPDEITMIAEEVVRKMKPNPEERVKIISVMTNAIGYEIFGEGTQDETHTYLLERAAERAYRQGIEGRD